VAVARARAVVVRARAEVARETAARAAVVVAVGAAKVGAWAVVVERVRPAVPMAVVARAAGEAMGWGVAAVVVREKAVAVVVREKVVAAWAVVARATVRNCPGLRRRGTVSRTGKRATTDWPWA